MTLPRTTVIDVPGEREALPVELFAPSEAGSRPAVVVVCEAWGLNDDIRRIAARFADEGFLAAAPDLYRGRHFARCMASAMWALHTGDGAAVRDLVAVTEALAARDEVTRVGVVGFCMGGGFALLLGSLARPDAVGDFYGAVSRRVDFDQVCPVFARYAGGDRLLRAYERRVERELGARGETHDFAVVPGVGHSFMNRSGPSFANPYRHEEAEAAWTEMLAFFRRHLT